LEASDPGNPGSVSPQGPALHSATRACKLPERERTSPLFEWWLGTGRDRPRRGGDNGPMVLPVTTCPSITAQAVNGHPLNSHLLSRYPLNRYLGQNVGDGLGGLRQVSRSQSRHVHPAVTDEVHAVVVTQSSDLLR
jgi:hypothetical protein